MNSAVFPQRTLKKKSICTFLISIKTHLYSTKKHGKLPRNSVFENLFWCLLFFSAVCDTATTFYDTATASWNRCIWFMFFLYMMKIVFFCLNLQIGKNFHFWLLSVCRASLRCILQNKNARISAGIPPSLSMALLHMNRDMNCNSDCLFFGFFLIRMTGWFAFTVAKRVTPAVQTTSTRRTLCFSGALTVTLFWKDFHRIFLSSDSSACASW